MNQREAIRLATSRYSQVRSCSVAGYYFEWEVTPGVYIPLYRPSREEAIVARRRAIAVDAIDEMFNLHDLPIYEHMDICARSINGAVFSLSCSVRKMVQEGVRAYREKIGGPQ